MTGTPLFSVIIPTFNRKETLVECLCSLGLQSLDAGRFEVIVVDDGSTDGTEAAVRAASGGLGPRITFLRQAQQGPGSARNLGARSAAGSILAFTEDDVRIDARWLERAEGYFADGSVSAVEGRTLLGEASDDLRLLETGRQLGFVPCNWFVRAVEFLSVGGYRPEYFDAATKLYFREDADFGFRLLESGKRVLFADDVLVTHPALYRSGSDFLRHARRYYFDALLYREHPQLYRSMIEVKRLAGVTIRRPFHYLCAVYIAGLGACCAGGILGSFGVAGTSLAVAAASFAALWYRYERRTPHLSNLPVLLRLPFVYFGALLRGCARFGSFGALW